MSVLILRDLNSNKFKGEIPREIGGLKFLKELYS
jgi:hypothetical protein